MNRMSKYLRGIPSLSRGHEEIGRKGLASNSCQHDAQSHEELAGMDYQCRIIDPHNQVFDWGKKHVGLVKEGLSPIDCPLPERK
jgi:hypothetical protein